MDHPDSGTSSQLQALGGLGARIPPAAVSGWFRLGLALGVVIAVLFPLVYVALAAAAVWAVCSVALGSGVVSGPTSRVYSLVSSGTFLAGACLLTLSLLKPLVAQPSRTAEPRFLDPEKEPLLFAFVRELASGGGIPEPSRLAVDCNANCCCVFAGGVGGFFRSGLVLQVGLPLVAGLRLDEFGGVLAHELAHAAQARAIWSSRFIWGVHAWFSRVAFEPDAVDERLLAWLEKAGAGARLVLRLVQGLFALGRGLLRLLVSVERAAISVFLRRMELQADRYQVRVAGTSAFISTVLDVNLLAYAADHAIVELSRMKREGRLVDNYPGLIAAIRDRYSTEFIQRLEARLERVQPSWFSAHPCDRNRIALACEEHRPGILTAGLPAANLFADYDALCREITLEFYDQVLRLKREGCKLVPLQNVLEELQ